MYQFIDALDIPLFINALHISFAERKVGRDGYKNENECLLPIMDPLSDPQN